MWFFFSISNHFLCFLYYTAHSGHMATEREETHFVVDSVVLWCLLTLLVISQDEEHGVTLKNVSFVIGQNGGEVSRIVCFLLAERKHRGSQTSLCWSSKTASPDHWFQFLKLQSTFPSLMLWDWSCPPRAGFCPAGRPGGGVIWYDSRFSPTTWLVHTRLEPSVWGDGLSGTILKDKGTGRCHRVPVSAVLGSLENEAVKHSLVADLRPPRLSFFLPVGNYLPAVCVESCRRRLWCRDV